MRNIFIILAVFFLLTACGEEVITEDGSSTLPPPTTTTPAFYATSSLSILKNTTNSYGDYTIEGISKKAGDTVIINFENPADAQKYTITQGFVFDNMYSFSITSNEKSFSETQLNVSVKNRNGQVILDNKPVYLYAVSKFYPVNPVLGNTPASNIFEFTTNKTQTIILNQEPTEYYNKYSDGSITSSSNTLITQISSYSFTNTNTGELDNNNISNNFTVDNTSPTIKVGSIDYQNCLTSIYFNLCAISVTYSGAGGENTSFYIRTQNKSYVDTKLDFFSN